MLSAYFKQSLPYGITHQTVAGGRSIPEHVYSPTSQYVVNIVAELQQQKAPPGLQLVELVRDHLADKHHIINLQRRIQRPL